MRPPLYGTDLDVPLAAPVKTFVSGLFDDIEMVEVPWLFSQRSRTVAL